MAPFYRGKANADIVVEGAPFGKSAPMNDSNKFGPKGLHELSKISWVPPSPGLMENLTMPTTAY